MKIFGINKLTLMDFPDRTACILFVGGCNMRCPFCHNSGIVASGSPIDQQEIVDYLTKRRAMLDGVVISGGEPTIYPDLPQYIASIRAMGFAIKLDTNGTHPDMLQQLISDGLVDYVAMDIKNSLSAYASTSGVDSIDTTAIERSIAILMSSSVQYEFRTTVVQQLHTADHFVEIAQLIAGAPRYYLQRYNDNGETFDNTLTPPSDSTLQQYADIVRTTVPCVEVR